MKTACRILLLTIPLFCGAAIAAGQTRPPASGPADRAQTQMAIAIPAMPMGSALNEFGRQTGLHVVMDAKLAQGLTSKSVDGIFTVESALTQLLGGTGLRFEYLDAKTVTIRLLQSGKASAAQGANLPGDRALASAASATLQRAEAAEPTGAPALAAEEGRDDPPEIVVTGSHIVRQTGSNSTQPVFTLTRQDIERTGAIFLGDLFRYIPQVSDISTGEAVGDSNATLGFGDVIVSGVPSVGINSNRVSAGLRGAPGGGTLILVNGRRAPRNGQMDGRDAYDVAGVPVGAIERIDVLPAGASAIYGADALGGVINIILRKDHSGTQVRLGHENTFDKDAGVVTGELSHQFSAGRLSGRVSGTFQESNVMELKDRGFTASLDRRPYGGRDFRGNPVLPFTPAGGSGKVWVPAGLLPGSTLGYAPIPDGSNGQSNQAEYLAGGAGLEPYDQAQYMQYNAPYERRGVGASLQYEFSRHLTIDLESRWSDNEMAMTLAPLAGNNISIPAGAPGNPFGVPVMLSKIFFDLPRGRTYAESTNHSGLLGLSGAVVADWQYRAGVSVGRAETDSRTEGASGFLPALRAAMNGPNPPILTYDSINGRNPNAAGVLEAFFNTTAPNEERVREWTYDVTLSGPVATLPSGKVRLAVGAEYRDSDVDFPLLDPASFDAQFLARAHDTNSSSYFAEMQLPLVGERWSRPGVRELSLSAAARRDKYTAFSGKTVMSYGVFYRPQEHLAVRSSWSEGFKVPTLLQRYAPLRTSQTFFDPLFPSPDPLRGGEPLDGIIPTLRGGNDQLRPERSETFSAGVEMNMPGIEGLRLTLDYFRNEYLDRIGGIDLLTQMVSFPKTITRDEPSPGDPPGWAGRVTSIDGRPVNTAFNRVAGWDVGVNYARQMSGTVLTMRAAMTKTTTNEFRPLEGAPLDPATSTDQLPMQMSGSMFLERGAWDAGVLFVHQGRKRSLPTYAYTDSATRWDVQASYDVAANGSAAPIWLRDTRISLTIFNVLDTRPPFTFNYLPDNAVLDSRMRRYSLSVVRDF